MPAPRISDGDAIDGIEIAQRPGRHGDGHQHDRVEQDLQPRRIRTGHHRQHRHAGARVIVVAEQRQRPEMRRRPEEDDQEQQDRLDRQRTRRRRPRHHRRQRAGGAADHDVLRGPALQPHRVDHDIEEDREGQQRAGKPVDEDAERHHREERQRQAEGQRLGRRARGRAGSAGWRCATSARRCRHRTTCSARRRRRRRPRCRGSR